MTELDSFVQTIDHRYRLAASGVVLSEVPEEADEADVDDYGGSRLYLSPREALAFADFVHAHRKQLEALQLELERLWVAAANAVLDVIETDRNVALNDLSSSTIYEVLEQLARAQPRSAVGRWYWSLWQGDTEAFKLQWGSFLRVWRRQRFSRRPDLFWRDIVSIYLPEERIAQVRVIRSGLKREAPAEVRQALVQRLLGYADLDYHNAESRQCLGVTGEGASAVRYAYLRHARVGHVEAARYCKADEDEAR